MMRRILSLAIVSAALAATGIAPALASQSTRGPVRAAAQLDSISLSDLPLDRPAYAAFLNDRTLLVSGPAQRLALVNLTTGRAAPFATLGEGPGEWRSVDALFSCAGQAGWVDGHLRRVIWYDPTTAKYARQVLLTPEVGAAGKPVSAACEAGSLWIAFEGRTSGQGVGGIVRDTIRVFHLDIALERFSPVATVLGSARLPKQKGNLYASLRLPWFLPPVLVPLGGEQVGVVLRASDSMLVYAASGSGTRSGTANGGSASSGSAGSRDTPSGNVRTVPLGRAGRAFTPAARALALDSMRQVIEDEMEAHKYDNALRSEFRGLHESLRADVVFPARWPLVRFAAADPNSVGGLIVVEHADMQTGESCVTVLAPTGREQRRRCYAWPGRTVHALLPGKGSLLWFQSNVDGESWMIRTTRP